MVVRLCANESYQNAESELEALTGVKLGHSTLHRLVTRQELHLPEALQKIPEVSLDGGKVRLRIPRGQECSWRDYKAVRLVACLLWGFFWQLSIPSRLGQLSEAHQPRSLPGGWS